MTTDHIVLQGKHIRLEPLEHRHVDGLVAAAGDDAQLYQWSPVPRGKAAAESYVDTALAWRDAGTAVPFAIVRNADGAVLGSTRFWNMERWSWPQGHPSHGRGVPDACEIGYTWLTGSALRTAVNTESKLLMLTYAFEVWQVLRVCFHTDARNERSSHGRGFHPSRFGALFNCGRGVAGRKTAVDWFTGSGVARNRANARGRRHPRLIRGSIKSSSVRSRNHPPSGRGFAATRAIESTGRNRRDL
jgi:N-acetyltransferase